MCTGIKFDGNKGNMFFGRNLDYGINFGERPIIAPAGYEINYRHLPKQKFTRSIVGMGLNVGNYPLFFEGNTTELCMAGLMFPNNAYYEPEIVEGKYNITSFEFIPWVLENYTSVDEVKDVIANKVNIVSDAFSPKLQPSPLHWMISDKEKTIVVEQTKDGIHVYDNDINTLTNNPEFPWHLQNLNNYIGLTPNDRSKTKWGNHKVRPQGVGTGAFGLPGDSTPQSRFIKAAYLNATYPTTDTELKGVSRMFNILKSVSMPLGSVVNDEGQKEYTMYSACYSQETQTYYYNWFDDVNIHKVQVTSENGSGDKIVEC
ncbi:choloylglycine hydrolase [Ligilactobacillus sp. LYQ135]